MSHVDDGTLHAYLDGELAPAEARGVGAHLAQCPICRRQLEEERALIARADELLGLAAPPDRDAPPPPFRPGDLTPPVRLWWQVRLPLAWAATIALALGIGTYLGGRSQRSVPQPAAPVTDAVRREVTAPRLPARAPAATAAPARGAMRRSVAVDAARKLAVDSALTLDSARALLGGDPWVVPGLPVRAIHQGRMIGYSALVIVEQALDPNTTIEVINGRRTPAALEAVVVSGAAQQDSVSAVKRAAPARAVARRADSLAPLPKASAAGAARPAPAAIPAPDRTASGLLLEVRGPLTPDSLAALQRHLQRLKP
jgi:hypothetical protein